jgi:uncharacterized coiled-coil protein SlyX
MATQHNILVNAPLEYYPRDEQGEFIDDITEITSTLFKESGVKCGCGSKKIHRNKYSFQQQHLSNKMHKKWLCSLNRNRADILKERVDLKKEIRDVRARETRARNVEVRLKNKLSEQLNIIKHQKKELVKMSDIITEQRNDIEQMAECLTQCTKKISTLEKKLEEEENKRNINKIILKDVEEFAIKILKNSGYDIE